MTMRIPSLFCAGLGSALITHSAFALDVRLYKQGETPDPREVAAILEAPKTRSIKMRSIRLLAQAPAEAGGAQLQTSMAPPEVDPVPSALALPVRFAFDSARVLPESVRALDALAKGIKLAGPNAKVVIEGHTDAAGSDAYNLTLSEKRALAVKTYLVLQHGILAETRRRAPRSLPGSAWRGIRRPERTHPAIGRHKAYARNDLHGRKSPGMAGRTPRQALAHGAEVMRQQLWPSGISGEDLSSWAPARTSQLPLNPCQGRPSAFWSC
jgi:outer membrane protein OmpA-like peptidoglycan-associated protein